MSEPSSVSVNGSPARLLADGIFEAEVPAVAGSNTFTVEAKDGTGNTRTSDFQLDVPASTASYAYDANGNLISRTENGTQTTYEWDVENRLKRVLVGGAEVARFAYDPLGRRIEKTTPAGTWRYAYDGIDIVRETAPGGTTTYVHGPGIDDPLARETAAATGYYHADGLGSIVKMTDQAGAVTLTRQYDAWGNLELGAAEAGYAFTGREWDPDTGLYYYRARYYDPKVGRFVSEDPIGFSGGANFFGYVGANPTNFRDPIGLYLGSGHDTILSQGLDGVATSAIIAALQTNSRVFDAQSQDPALSYMHAMAPPGTGPATAAYLAEQFVEQHLSTAATLEAAGKHDLALEYLAEGMHTIMDAYSLPHAGYETWEGLSLKKLPAAALHGLQDLGSEALGIGLDAAARDIRTYYERFRRLVDAKCR
ncbi:MAG: RHS repeat-associated core domain-containing protein [Vicinamibacteria bacterium]